LVSATLPRGLAGELASMEKQQLLDFLTSNRLGVLSTIGPKGGPQSALVGFAITHEFEIVFDTVSRSRKFVNLARDPRAAFVIGWDGETTVQFEGVARQISSSELGHYHETYFRAFPDGPARLKWEGITYYVVKPKWIRYSDFAKSPPEIEEFLF
jgi:Pyridoxamine 5'-phosphate oxidase